MPPSPANCWHFLCPVQVQQKQTLHMPGKQQLAFLFIIRHPGHCSQYRSKAWESKTASSSFFSCSIVACALTPLQNTKCHHRQTIQQSFVAAIGVSASPSFLLMHTLCLRPSLRHTFQTQIEALAFDQRKAWIATPLQQAFLCFTNTTKL